jgi:hypothetical protein
MIGRIILLLLVGSAVQAEPWESSLASVASLRTGGASLVSSDSMRLDHGQFVLITYWEARSGSNLDVYRCVDITDSSFATVSQQCWRALRPTGRGPRVIDGVTSSQDLCGQPESPSRFSAIAFCAFSDPFTVQTAYFKVVIDPFDSEGLVAVREEGRYLLVTDEALPASAFFEVRADGPAAYPELSGLTGPEELLGQPPEGLLCEAATISGREWIRCQASETPLSVAHYTMTDGTVYSVVFSFDASLAASQTIRLMFDSLQLLGSDN